MPAKIAISANWRIYQERTTARVPAEKFACQEQGCEQHDRCPHSSSLYDHFMASSPPQKAAVLWVAEKQVSIVGAPAS